MAQTHVLVGYLDADGTQDAMCVSPSWNGVQGGIVSQVVAAVVSAGVAPVWADCPRAGLAAAVASALGIAQGEPAGWGEVAADDSLGRPSFVRRRAPGVRAGKRKARR